MCNLVDPDAKYDMCLMTYQQNMRKLVEDLISVMEKEFHRNLRKCVMWLENAHHGVSIFMDQLRAYEESYLACENLTYACKGKDTFEIKLHIPAILHGRLAQLLRGEVGIIRATLKFAVFL